MFLFQIIIKLICMINHLLLMFAFLTEVLNTVQHMGNPKARRTIIYLIFTTVAEILTIALILNA